MTSEQLKAAAFKYCELRGIDPNQKSYDKYCMYDVLMYCEEWENVAKMLEEHWAKNESLQYAQQL